MKRLWRDDPISVVLIGIVILALVVGLLAKLATIITNAIT